MPQFKLTGVREQSAVEISWLGKPSQENRGFPEQLLEQRERAAPAGGAVHALDVLRGRLEVRVGRPLDRHVGHRPLAALELRQHGFVQPVDVIAELDLAGVVDERGLVADVDRDMVGEIDLALLAAEHALQAAWVWLARGAA